ncbi:acyltransferase domain-containing protein [Streptomyces sp. NRRL F-2664]|uniref:acyltransferase domain-containing protein n=1 Tax=Streptomyces sp. NRRL F-2664 TaxID=1463842 RepID=UPI00131B9202|nr:acyltransferase domain-containing protein [Streptomyces sp. NRRL F-2664]
MGNRILVQFPGLGSYVPGVLADVVANAPQLGSILADVDRVAGQYGLGPVSVPLTDPSGPLLEDLADTPTLLHLASFTSAYVLYQALRAKGFEEDMLLGHSTGEITALVAGGALSVADGARVLCEREVALSDVGPRGGLVALQTGARHAEHLCAAAGGWSVQVSLRNSPVQTVVSGIDEDLARLEAVARGAGVSATRLLVRYPHHNTALRLAGRRLAEAVASVPITDPAARIFSPILDHTVSCAVHARQIVERHLTDPVGYVCAIRSLYDDFGVREFLEVGVRPVLTDLAREILPATAAVLGPPPLTHSAAQILAVLAGSPTISPAAHRFGGSVSEADEVATSTIVQEAPVAAAPEDVAVNSGERPVLPGRDVLEARIRSVFAQALGYPEDVFTDDAHLEADLGITSVRKIDLLVRLLDEYQLPTPPARLRMRDYSTVPKLAELMQSLPFGEVAV